MSSKSLAVWRSTEAEEPADLPESSDNRSYGRGMGTEASRTSSFCLADLSVDGVLLLLVVTEIGICVTGGAVVFSAAAAAG